MPSQDKSVLCPIFVSQLIIFEQKLKEVNLPFYLFMGMRTFEEQNELYAQGRTKPGKIVTNARGGDSYHNYGLAADYVLDGMIDKPGIQWSWNIKSDLNYDGHNDWRQMAELAQDCGLEAGYFWKRFPDAPHVQLRLSLTLHEIKELYAIGGLQNVWKNCEVKL